MSNAGGEVVGGRADEAEEPLAQAVQRQGAAGEGID